MKVSEVRGGTARTVQLRSVDTPLSVLRPGQEVSLMTQGDELLLASHDGAWSVVGANRKEQEAIDGLLGNGLPILTYVAMVHDETSVFVEIRQLGHEVRSTDPMTIGVPDAMVDELRSLSKQGGTVDLLKWIDDALLLPTPPRGPEEMRRLIITGDTSGRLDAFRIHGHRLTVDVATVDGRLRIDRVVRNARRQGRLLLLWAPTRIVDQTSNGPMREAIHVMLTRAVNDSGSYLASWRKYAELEERIVREKAWSFGALEYVSRERDVNGGWKFVLGALPPNTVRERLAPLGDSDRFELMAAADPPDLKSDKGQERRRSVPGYSAGLRSHDGDRSLTLADLDDNDDKEDPPPKGFLSLSTGGDKARIQRRSRAEEALRTGTCPMPQLGLLMEGRPNPSASRSKINIKSKQLRQVIAEAFAPAAPTAKQLEAIDAALGTPDICLIQGPPGTGKTKVITAIEQCLAALADDGAGPGHRVLVCAAQHDAVDNVAQRSEVFGLPAMKIGRRRRAGDTAVDPAEQFARKRIGDLKASLVEPLEAERLTKARGILLMSVSVPALPLEHADQLEELCRVLDKLLPPDLRDRAQERARALRLPTGGGEPEAAELLLKAARGLRVERVAFSDDGPLQARKALVRLAAVLTADERSFLERCSVADDNNAPEWIEQGAPIRDALIDRLMAPTAAPLRSVVDAETRELMMAMMESVQARILRSREGADAAVAQYLHDLEHDPAGVGEALQHYTLVLASTLQHAAGRQMALVRGLDLGATAPFETVIVDEAARANPLDLFIPLSMTGRRAVLVGDHRQLPHLLEPDVERQLAAEVEAGTVESEISDAVKASLFERLWVQLRGLERRDGFPRTVTLDAQYRMHPALGGYVSREFYEARDDPAINSPRPASDFFHELPEYRTKGGLPAAAAWLDVPRDLGSEHSRLSKSRPVEAQRIAREVRRLIHHDPNLTFGVIAFYKDQVTAIGEAMANEGLTELTNDGWTVSAAFALTSDGRERLRFGTVDAFQGKEFDVVLLSITRSNTLPGGSDERWRRKYGHLMLENRLCVAMSRQQRLLIAVGDLDFVRADDAKKPLRALQSFIELCGGEHGLIR
jgi:hypothetical protein